MTACIIMNPVVGCHHLPPGPQWHTCIVMNPVVGCHHLPPGPHWHTCIVINPVVGCLYFLPGPQLPSQPSGITALRPVPTYCLVTETHRCEKLAQRFYAINLAETRTHDLLIASVMLYRQCHNASRNLNDMKKTQNAVVIVIVLAWKHSVPGGVAKFKALSSLMCWCASKKLVTC